MAPRDYVLIAEINGTLAYGERTILSKGAPWKSRLPFQEPSAARRRLAEVAPTPSLSRCHELKTREEPKGKRRQF